MESLIDMKLELLSRLDPEDLKILSDYNIFTIGQLLGATKGLQNSEFFELLIEGEELEKSIRDLFPDSFLQEYEKRIIDKPMGYRGEDDDESNKK